MEKIEFQKIMDALAKRIELCELHLGNIHTADDLSKLTIAVAADLKNFCIAEEEVMTKIVMVDLYHVIGMGELTPPQMMKFTYTIQKYLQYRPAIKAIAKHLESIFELPKIPVATQYKLMSLGDVTLTSGVGEIVTEEASVEDYKQPKQRTLEQTLLPFRIEGSQIRVDMTQFDFFVTLMTNLFKSPLSADNFRKKITTKGEYIGIEWIVYDGYEAIGQIKSAESFAKLSGYYNNRYNNRK
jgi:hypothetical protein